MLLYRSFSAGFQDRHQCRASAVGKMCKAHVPGHSISLMMLSNTALPSFSRVCFVTFSAPVPDTYRHTYIHMYTHSTLYLLSIYLCIHTQIFVTFATLPDSLLPPLVASYSNIHVSIYFLNLRRLRGPLFLCFSKTGMDRCERERERQKHYCTISCLISIENLMDS